MRSPVADSSRARIVPAVAVCVARRLAGLTLAALVALAPDAHAQGVSYRLSFPEREHRLMDVELSLTNLPPGRVELRMSRSSPGRYAVHEFAKNVFDVRITDGSGGQVTVTRPTPHRWDVAGHSGSLRVTYRVFGDRLDGTYLAVDSTHAHVNMPAALMWARGLETRPIQVRFEPPAGVQWQVATQLLPTADPFVFTAPNLQYAMDSPAEFGGFTWQTFPVADGSSTPTFRLALHHAGDEALLVSFRQDVEQIVREARRVFGTFAPFDGGTYTFIADYLPWASGDGMEHRNSTVLTSSSSIRTNRQGLLRTVSHEFFHSWNVERIRPRSLEPFDFDDANISGELWFAEGFTNYYGPLVMRRAGLMSVADFAESMGRAVTAVVTSPGRRLRTAEEMSQHAAFVDAAAAIDRTSFDNTFLSYYTWGQAIGLGLDLELRDRTGGRVTLDDVMRAMWERHGRPAAGPVGTVERPYTLDDVRAVLGEVAGDEAFARDFVARFVQGHEVVDYARLLARAGFALRPVAAGRAYAGGLRLQSGASGARVTASVPFGSPAYAAGLERDDVILTAGGTAITSEQDFERALAARRPGDEMPVVFERRGARVSATVRLAAVPDQEIVPIETLGQSLTEPQRRFRNAWLESGGR